MGDSRPPPLVLLPPLFFFDLSFDWRTLSVASFASRCRLTIFFSLSAAFWRAALFSSDIESFPLSLLLLVFTEDGSSRDRMEILTA